DPGRVRVAAALRFRAATGDGPGTGVAGGGVLLLAAGRRLGDGRLDVCAGTSAGEAGARDAGRPLWAERGGLRAAQLRDGGRPAARGAEPDRRVRARTEWRPGRRSAPGGIREKPRDTRNTRKGKQ